MQDNTAKLFVSDEELEIFELTKIGFDQSMEDFLREKKAISLEFARQFNLNFTVSGDEIKPAIDYILDAIGKASGITVRTPAKVQLLCLLANLYRQHSVHPELWTKIYRRHEKPIPAMNNPSGISWKTLARLTDGLHELGYLDLVKGIFARDGLNRPSKSSRVRATGNLITVLENEFQWSLKNIGFHAAAEPIIMKDKKQKRQAAPIIAYIDTPSSISDRELLSAYNRFIQKQEILCHDGFGKALPDLIFTTRVFSNGSWNEGGRLFGGHFQNMSKDIRLKITVNGQAVREVDISSCHASMAFAEVGEDWFANHNQDLYQFKEAANWPRHIIKTAFSIMLNVDNETSAIKALVREATRDLWAYSYEQIDRPKWYRNLIADMKLAYPAIAPNFCKARGMHYMWQEGEIALMVIKECLQQGIPVLTLHDSYIMPEQHASFVTDVVKTAFRRVVGVNCVVR